MRTAKIAPQRSKLVNANYAKVLEEAGMILSGTSMDGELPEMVEVQDHPWFVATQAHPEFESRPLPLAPSAIYRFGEGCARAGATD